MATIHRTTMAPTKLELLADWLPRQPWFIDSGTAPALTRAGGFRLDDPAGEVGIEFMLVTDGAGGGETTYFVPLSYRGAPLDGADDGLVGTSEHGVLGTRWIYDAAYDPVAVTQLLAFLSGTAEAQQQSESDTPDPSVGRSWVSVDGRLVAPTPLRVSNSGPEGTTIAVELTGDPVQRSLEVVRVPAPSTEADGAALGSVEADWRRLDGGTARGRVALVR